MNKMDTGQTRYPSEKLVTFFDLPLQRLVRNLLENGNQRPCYRLVANKLQTSFQLVTDNRRVGLVCFRFGRTCHLDMSKCKVLLYKLVTSRQSNVCDANEICLQTVSVRQTLQSSASMFQQVVDLSESVRLVELNHFTLHLTQSFFNLVNNLLDVTFHVDMSIRKVVQCSSDLYVTSQKLVSSNLSVTC